MGETVILRQDHCRVVYRMGAEVHKKRKIGLDYEYLVGRYLNTFHNSSYVETLGYKVGRLTTKFVPGTSWYSSLTASDIKLETCTAQALAILQVLEQLPVTHYDLHTGNVIFPAGQQPCLIDFGCAAIPPAHWTPEVQYCEASYPAISCGIFPSILDPDYDRMLFLLAMSQLARRFQLTSLAGFCRGAITQAHFNHPLFYGYEDFLPLELIQRYHFLFHRDRQPLLVRVEPRTREELTQGLEQLQEEIPRNPDKLEQWRCTNESRVYALLYGYKLHRIAQRKVPSFAAIRAAVLAAC
jgi:hypothetical protein